MARGLLPVMRLLMLDLDNTLVDRDAAFRAAATALLAEHALPETDIDWLMTLDASGYTPKPAVTEAMVDRYGTALPEDAALTNSISSARRITGSPGSRQASPVYHCGMTTPSGQQRIRGRSTPGRRSGRTLAARCAPMYCGWSVSRQSGACPPLSPGRDVPAATAPHGPAPPQGVPRVDQQHEAQTASYAGP